MIGIRADANEQIASGHVMRCLSIADALSSLGEDVLFFTADTFAEEWIIERGYKTICLHSDWNDKDGELPRLLKEIDGHRLDLLLIDSYQVTVKYLQTLHETVRLAYIDDLNAFDYPVDVVINYSIYAEQLIYPHNKRYLLGTSYTPLRKQFNISDPQLEQAISDRNDNRQILITTGAADPLHVAESVIKSVLKEPLLQAFDLVIVKGRFSAPLQYNNDDHIIVLEDVVDMAELMLKSNMAVSAGGSTLYELCACSVPTVTFSYTDNQIGNVQSFAQRGIMEYAGDAREDANIGETIVQKLLLYIDTDRKTTVEKRMRELRCGNGATNLAKALARLVHDQ